jgi:hypothetical protein
MSEWTTPGAATMSQLSKIARSVLLASVTLAIGGSPAAAANVTACTALDLCYCINADNRAAIDANVKRVRQLIADQKAQGKSIGYLSIPLSTAGGAYFGINSEVAAQTKARIEQRFGANSVWILNPGAEGNLPTGATGADYMDMWTQILEGDKGLGEDFDFFYFTGPAEFAQFFALTGEGDFAKLEAYFDARMASDPGFKKAVDQGAITKASFRNYYGLKASVAFSYGSHDEWNIAGLINERRRGADAFGIANQLSILFDGRAVTPGNFQSPVASGDTGRCIN